jgi:predicted Zn-dependent protease
MRRTTLDAGLRVVVAAAVASLAVACSVNPATGERQLTLISEAQEIEMGREADQEISASLGLYPDESAQSYVSALGKELAAKSERPDLPWSFKVVDDSIVNAFALPGGFIYVTRGIMAHLNSEAEQVADLGHEIGHVTGRHSVERLSKAQLANMGLGVGMIVSPELRQFGDLAQMGMGLLFLKYSRDDEREADDLGLRYSLRGGYDAREMPEVFTVLKRVGEIAGAGGIPNWLATHPDPEQRRQRIEGMLAEHEGEFEGLKIERANYFQRLDGMTFGPNPREGYFKDGVFYHPDLAFQLSFPQGWKTNNQRQAVSAMNEEQDALMQLTLAQDAETGAAVQRFLGQEGVEAGQVRSGRINGLDASWALFEVPDEQNPLAGRVVCVRYGENTFQLMGLAKRDSWTKNDPALDRSQRSFARVTERRFLDVQPARVKLERIPRAMTLREFSQRYPSSVDLETLALINHTQPDDRLQAGTTVKRVVGGMKG